MTKVATRQDERAGSHVRPRLLAAGLTLVLVGAYLGLNLWSVWPWVEARLFVVTAGSLLIWASGIGLDRRLVVLAGSWVAASTVSAVFGVDVMRSLVGREGEGAGLTLFAVCAFLLVAGASLLQKERKLVARWVVRLGLVASGIVIVAALPGQPLGAVFPSLQETLTWNGAGGTFGNPLWLIGGLSVSLAALLHFEPDTPTPWFYASLTCLALGLGLARQTSSLIIPAVVIACWAWKARPHAITFWSVTLLLVAIIGSFFVTTGGGVGVPTSEVAASGASLRNKMLVWEADLSGVAERPLVGWGPGNAGSAYMHSVSPATSVQLKERYWADAHNIFVQTLVTTGILGLLAFLLLATQVVPGLVLASGDSGWTLGAVAALGTLMLYEPISVQAMPLMFLAAGLGNSGSINARSHPQVPHLARVGIGIVLTACLVLTAVGTVSTTLLLEGTSPDSEWALRAAVAVEPWRQEASEVLAIRLADSGGRQPMPNAEGTEAMEIVSDLIAAKPWDPNVRIHGIRIAARVGDKDAAEAWMLEQLELFPADRDYIRRGVQENFLPPLEVP